MYCEKVFYRKRAWCGNGAETALWFAPQHDLGNDGVGSVAYRPRQPPQGAQGRHVLMICRLFRVDCKTVFTAEAQSS